MSARKRGAAAVAIVCVSLTLVANRVSMKLAAHFDEMKRHESHLWDTTSSPKRIVGDSHAESVVQRPDMMNKAVSKGNVKMRQALEHTARDAPADTTVRSTLYDPIAFREGIENGVLSTKDTSFFRKLQADIDDSDDTARCARYGWNYNATSGTKRRIFYGSLIGGEPWELLEIAAAESHGIFSGMVFVEGNRTQNLTPRQFRQLHQGAMIANLFGVPANQVSVRPYVDENEDFATEKSDLFALGREHRQRAEILRGWKALGMQPDDIGYLADVDEIMTRDVFRAMQWCDGIEAFDFEAHQCHHSKIKIIGTTRVFQGSPECIAKGQEWYHPDLIIGHCVEEIGNVERYGLAPRSGDSVYRAKGFGRDGEDWEGERNITTGYYPLWNAADFRRTVGGSQLRMRHAGHDAYTAFHFHNFMAQLNHTRFKYMTYGHATKEAGTKPYKDLNQDAHLLISCVQGVPYPPDQNYQHVPGGFAHTPPYLPIYFYDADYRQRRHNHIRKMIESDEAYMAVLHAQLPKDAPVSRSRPVVTTPETKRSIAQTAAQSPGNSSSSLHATVIAMATGYDVSRFRQFVGSLRKSGFLGHVIIGLEPNPRPEVLEYLSTRNVTIKRLSWVNCTYSRSADETEDIFKKTTCASPYPDIKIRWSRFPLARDWLTECASCTGPVLLTDARDAVFQRDPFGPGSPKVEGLQVFQEDAAMTTENWLTEWPIRECKNVTFKETMLCSGTTIGTRAAVLEYLEIMYDEMKAWIEDPKCRFNINGDDQAIHNYLFYSGKFSSATSIPNRQGGIVNTVGAYGGTLFNKLVRPIIDAKNTSIIQYPGASTTTWISVDYGVTNAQGLVTELDGSVSRVLHQIDRFGYPYTNWLDEQAWANDSKDDPPPQPPESQGASSSLHATVIAMATGYEIPTFRRFVGSLRNSGFLGHVIIGLGPSPPQDVIDYLHRRNVTIKTLSWTNCTYSRSADEKEDIFKKTNCTSPYPDIKIRWSRFPLARDWLVECTSCVGPVLLTDARDVVFQRDPFGPGSPKVEGLQVFQEDLAMTTKNWLTEWPIRECKNVTFQQPMLCSGTTIGTRAAMLKYLAIMYEEMKVWIEDPKCRFNINGDDQAIHNYLFYSGKFPFASSIPNRRGGIVNTVGAYGSTLFKKLLGPIVDAGNTSVVTYPGATETSWIGVDHGITNKQGLLTELDGSISRVLHQIDRFEGPYLDWLKKQSRANDT